MRVGLLVSFVVISGLGSHALAQDSPLYSNREDRFAVIFPGPPVAKDIAYTTRTGTSLPARQYSFEDGDNRYAVTIVVFKLGRAADSRHVEHAAEILRKRGQILYQARATYDWGIPGRQLNIMETTGRQLRASVYMHDHHLVITEASAEMGNIAALQFEQSITLLDRNGAAID